jgi:hypothetical protein
MNEIDHGAKHLGVGFGEDAMAQIEDVTGLGTRRRKYSPRGCASRVHAIEHDVWI